MTHAYQWLLTSTDAHPMTYLRLLLAPEVRSIRDLYRTPHNTTVFVARIVTARQRPETAGRFDWCVQISHVGLAGESPVSVATQRPSS